jgi:hypothetical protein
MVGVVHKVGGVLHVFEPMVGGISQGIEWRIWCS